MKKLLVSIAGLLAAAWVVAAVVEVPLAPASIMIIGGGVTEPPPAETCEPPDCILQTVCAAGCDHTEVDAGLAYFKANESLGTAILKLEIQDSRTYTYTTRLLIDDFTGTPSITSYFWITSNATDPANYPTIAQTTDSYVIDVRTNYTRIERLDIHVDNGGTSNEGIRVRSDGGTGTLISRNVIRGNWNSSSGGGSDQDGIYTGSWAIPSLYIDNNIIYGFQRAGLQLQNNSIQTQNIYIDFNTIVNQNNNDGEGGSISTRAAVTGITNLYAYNTLGPDWNQIGSNVYRNYASCKDVSCFFFGSSQIAMDLTAEDKWANSFDLVVKTDTAPTSGPDEYMWFTDISAWPMDLRIAGENAYTVTQFGTDRNGQEPDPRQDFSVDIGGNTRKATPTIGAWERL